MPLRGACSAAEESANTTPRRCSNKRRWSDERSRCWRSPRRRRPSRPRSALPARAGRRRRADMKFRVCDPTGKRRNAKAMTAPSHTRQNCPAGEPPGPAPVVARGRQHVKMRFPTRAPHGRAPAQHGGGYDVDLASPRVSLGKHRAHLYHNALLQKTSSRTPRPRRRRRPDRAVHVRSSNEARRPVAPQQSRVARRVDGEV